MTEFLKDKFSSRPNSKEYRTGWDRTFGKETHAIDCDMDEDCMCGEGMETVVAVSGAMFEVKVTLESAETRPSRSAASAGTSARRTATAPIAGLTPNDLPQVPRCHKGNRLEDA